MKSKIQFVLKEAFIHSGHFHKETFHTLIECAPSYLKTDLKKLWNQIRLTRVITLTLSLFRYILLSISLLYIESNLSTFLIYFISGVLLRIIQYYFGNYLQDTLMFYEGVLSNIPYLYISKRNYPDYNKVKINLENTIHNIVQTERHTHAIVEVVNYIGFITWLALALAPQMLSMIIVLLLVFTVINAILPITMNIGYDKLYEQNEKITNDFINLKDITTKEATSITNRKLKLILHYLSINKGFINLGSISFSALLTYKIFQETHHSNYIFLSLLIARTSASFFSVAFIFLRNIPELNSQKYRILQPLVNALNNYIPTPITQKTKLSKPINIDSFEFLRIKDLLYSEDKHLLLNIPSLKIPLKKGLYTLIGDSGEGKSIFLSIIGNKNNTGSGKISLHKDNKSYKYSDLGYTNLSKIIKYVWITQEEFNNTTPLKLFRARLVNSSNHFRNIVSNIPTKINLQELIDNNNSFLLNTARDTNNPEEELLDNIVNKALNKLLFETGLFKANEKHILDTDIARLSGGQQARLITAFYLTGPQQILLIDEGLERTTKNFTHDGEYLYTRERLINFFSFITKRSNKTIILIVQGGEEELNQIKAKLGSYHLGTMEIRNKGLINIYPIEDSRTK